MVGLFAKIWIYHFHITFGCTPVTRVEPSRFLAGGSARGAGIDSGGLLADRGLGGTETV